MIYLLSNEGEKNIALRFSELEGLDTILTMKNKVKWVWVDCFSQLPITYNSYKLLKDNGCEDAVNYKKDVPKGVLQVII